MYGWYHVYHPKWSSLNAAVKDTDVDQTFTVNTEVSSCTAAINAVGGVGVELNNGSLFETQYIAGSTDSGGQYGGKMWQNGTNYWAGQGKGYTFMCHYYRDKSATEPIHFFYY